MTNVREWLRSVIAQLPIELLLAFGVGGIVSLLKWVAKRIRRRQFKRLFGTDAREYHLAFGSMAVHPVLMSVAGSVNAQLARFPLMKPGRPDMAFSAQSLASGCEIRAVAYVSSALSKDGGIPTAVVTDDSISSRLDIDFVSFGAMSNLKTLDIFANPANQLAEYDPTSGFFVSKSGRQPLYQRREGYDYGIILKMHPRQFPRRTWICCAGWGEWGTSGSAWFLANKWKHIAHRVPEDGQFVGVIEVRIGQDESAQLLSMAIEPRPGNLAD